MRRRNLQSPIAIRSRMIAMSVAILALVVLNVFDVHAAETETRNSAAELIQIDNDGITIQATAEANESHYCQSSTACQVGLEAVCDVPAWTIAGESTFPRLSCMIGSSPMHGLFRPPKHA